MKQEDEVELEEQLELVANMLTHTKRKVINVGEDEIEMSISEGLSIELNQSNVFEGRLILDSTQELSQLSIQDNIAENQRDLSMEDSSIPLFQKPKPTQRYIPKHLSPQQLLNYYGVNIRVVFGSSVEGRGDILLVPCLYEDGWEEVNEILGRTRAVGRVLQTMKTSRNKNLDINTYHISGKNIDFEGNYIWLMIHEIKLNNRFSMLVQLLKESLQQQLEMCSDQGIKKLTIPRLNWHGLSMRKKCQSTLDCLLKYIRRKVKEIKLTITEVTICIDKIDEYFVFVNEMRRISDEVVREGVISGW